VGTSPPKDKQVQSQDPSIPATTTFQQDLVTAGQRHINVMWERTQQIIAITIAVAVTSVCSTIILQAKDDSLRAPAFMLLSNVFFLVVGTYFQRTNHTKTGGVGPRDSSER
jgi:cytochrome bd-type quinol oxidase subunit 2